MKRTIALVLALLLLTACGGGGNLPGGTAPEPPSGGEASLPEASGSESEAPEEPPAAAEIALPLQPFADVRAIPGQEQRFAPGDFSPEHLMTFTFNQGTVFSGSEAQAMRILDDAKNPGLGVRGLHRQGITGKGVNVAIIDQHLLLNHPEFTGKIADYHDTGCDTPESSGSMHAPAVTSLLVGESIGTAPGARVYYAAVPSWLRDSKYYADALHWVVEQNRLLPADEKIRVVSISAAPSGMGSPFEKNHELYDEAVALAQSEGILVLDCREDDHTGFIAAAYYDPQDPENVKAVTSGWPMWDPVSLPFDLLAVPCSYRTVAEQYTTDTPSYQYNGQGGLSWAIPYAAGVLALGWQLNLQLGGDEMARLLQSSSFFNRHGSRIIDPPAFIEAVKATLEA